MTPKPFLQLQSGLMIYRHIKSIYTNYMMYIKYPRYQIYNLHGALHLFLVDKRKSSGMRSESSYLIVAVQCLRVPYLCVCLIFFASTSSLLPLPQCLLPFQIHWGDQCNSLGIQVSLALCV